MLHPDRVVQRAQRVPAARHRLVLAGVHRRTGVRSRIGARAAVSRSRSASAPLSLVRARPTVTGWPATLATRRPDRILIVVEDRDGHLAAHSSARSASAPSIAQFRARARTA
jgi:hypothetical protein